MNQTVSDVGTIAYFSMDVAIESNIPTYSGGLGILAGDTLRSAADLGVRMVAVTLLPRKGYFDQRLDAYGNQSESPSKWSPEDYLEPLPHRVMITIEGRQVKVRGWQFLFRGVRGHVVPLILLDTDLEENEARDRALTDQLYGGDEHYRLCQEVVLGFGGMAMIRAIGYRDVQTYHMNEGHSAFVALALLEQANARLDSPDVDLEAIRRQCVFTTHTPVPAGHDRFPSELIYRVLGTSRAAILRRMQILNGSLNMTELALRLSGFVNAVSMRHRQVSGEMFPGYAIEAITNGVHAAAWTSAAFAALYDRAIPEWRYDNCYLRHAIGIPLREIQRAHQDAKKELFQQVRWLTGTQLDPSVFTLGFARRATSYKRGDLLFTNLERLKQISRQAGPLQLVYAGKAHPRDEGGKAIIRRIFEAAATLANEVRVVYLENYDMALGKLLCSGVDVWLNTPLRPQEASGTSGMKAALNGVPSFSVLDGWWIEGHIEGITGWAIGESNSPQIDPSTEVHALYDKLQRLIVPLFYNEPERFGEVMRWAIALNGSFFNTQRMVSQYLRNAYLNSAKANEPLD